MAKENVKSTLVYLRISETSVADALAAGKIIVCEEDSAWNSTATVNETVTKCGSYKTASIPGNTVTGKGVVVGNLASNEVSAQQLKTWINTQTTLYVAYQNDADAGSSFTAGEVVYMTGSGYFSTVNVTSNTGDGMLKYDFEFQLSGAVDTTV